MKQPNPFSGQRFGVITPKASLALAASFLLLNSCKKDLTPPDSETPSTVAALQAQAAKAPNIVVHAGQSIQAAVNTAAPNSVIKIEPGIYLESIEINKPGITLIGAEGNSGEAVIQNPGSAPLGVVVTDGGDGFVMKNITIRNFTQRATNITYVDGFLLSHVTVSNSGEFGLFVEYCKNGTIENCEGSGFAETPFFVGYSTDVVVTKSKSHDNVIGFESENSSDVTFEKNEAFNNTVGILTLLVPGRDIKSSSGIVVSKNDVYGNNLPNFSLPPEKESVLPSGVGILNVGTDDLVVQQNSVTNNKYLGIVSVSSLVIGQLSGLPPEAFADIEPNPDGLRVIKNTLSNNAYEQPPLPFPAVDLLWDGTGTDPCWKQNKFTTSYPSPLPQCP